jgi:hypothetical protein
VTLYDFLPHLNSIMAFLINQNRVPRNAFDHGLQSNKSYQIVKNIVALLVD